MVKTLLTTFFPSDLQKYTGLAAQIGFFLLSIRDHFVDWLEKQLDKQHYCEKLTGNAPWCIGWLFLGWLTSLVKHHMVCCLTFSLALPLPTWDLTNVLSVRPCFLGIVTVRLKLKYMYIGKKHLYVLFRNWSGHFFTTLKLPKIIPPTSGY